MATITAISPTLIAIDNAAHHSVYRGTEECVARVLKKAQSERIKYINLPPEMEMVGGPAAADAAWWAAAHRSADTASPLGETSYEDGDYHYFLSREEHACPWTGEKWITESTRGYAL